jgi:predicted Abi (CAAX) family protease
MLGNDLRRILLPWGTARADWEWNAAILGSSLSQNPLKDISIGLRSWRTLLPSVAARTLARVFLRHGASLWVLRTNQVGGHDPDIEPLIPNI